MIQVTDADCLGTDEIRTTFYACPVCKCPFLTADFNYCPLCGEMLDWSIFKSASKITVGFEIKKAGLNRFTITEKFADGSHTTLSIKPTEEQAATFLKNELAHRPEGDL